MIIVKLVFRSRKGCCSDKLAKTFCWIYCMDVAGRRWLVAQPGGLTLGFVLHLLRGFCASDSAYRQTTNVIHTVGQVERHDEYGQKLTSFQSYRTNTQPQRTDRSIRITNCILH